MFPPRRQFSLDDMEVGAADPAGTHPEQHVSGYHFGTWDVLDGKGVLGGGTGSTENCCFHDMCYDGLGV